MTFSGADSERMATLRWVGAVPAPIFVMKDDPTPFFGRTDTSVEDQTP